MSSLPPYHSSSEFMHNDNYNYFNSVADLMEKLATLIKQEQELREDLHDIHGVIQETLLELKPLVAELTEKIAKLTE